MLLAALPRARRSLRSGLKVGRRKFMFVQQHPQEEDTKPIEVEPFSINGANIPKKSLFILLRLTSCQQGPGMQGETLPRFYPTYSPACSSSARTAVKVEDFAREKLLSWPGPWREKVGISCFLSIFLAPDWRDHFFPSLPFTLLSLFHPLFFWFNHPFPPAANNVSSSLGIPSTVPTHSTFSSQPPFPSANRPAHTLTLCKIF